MKLVYSSGKLGKLYEPKTREKILYFPKLNVGFIKGETLRSDIY